jgi:hypothetical protein
MKYIKTYTKLLTSRECLKTLFESNESQWVKDSLLDLTDEGYNVNIRTFTVTGENTPGLAITIDSSNKKLLPFSIGEYLLTIDSYLKERGFKGYNPFDWDNEFSKSRYVVRVRALLNDETNSYELKEFNDMLIRGAHSLDSLDIRGGSAPFDSVTVYYFKPQVKPQVTQEVRVSKDTKPLSEAYSRSESVNEHYLKKYKVREGKLVKSISDKELPYIREVLLDLNDRGIKTVVSLVTGHGTGGYPNVYVEVTNTSNSIDVSSCLSHIKSYMLWRDWVILDERDYESDDLFNDGVEMPRTYSIMFKRLKDLDNI